MQEIVCQEMNRHNVSSLEFLVLSGQELETNKSDSYEKDLEVAEMKMQDHLGWLLTLKKSRAKLAFLGDLVQLLVPKLFFLNSRVTSAIQTQVTEETAV